MKIMFADSFYTEFEIYETENPEDLIEQAKNAYFIGGDIDTEKHHVIGCQYDMDTEEATKQADRIFLIGAEELEECFDTEKTWTEIREAVASFHKFAELMNGKEEAIGELYGIRADILHSFFMDIDDIMDTMKTYGM